MEENKVTCTEECVEECVEHVEECVEKCPQECIEKCPEECVEECVEEDDNEGFEEVVENVKKVVEEVKDGIKESFAKLMEGLNKIDLNKETLKGYLDEFAEKTNEISAQTKESLKNSKKKTIHLKNLKKQKKKLLM